MTQQVGVDPSTISRELARHRKAYPDQPYQANNAQQRCQVNTQRKACKLQGLLEEQVRQRLRQRFSPEQISGVLALEAGRKVISHETIYTYIYRHQNAGNKKFISLLRTRHKKIQEVGES